jgi:hypothetical protein
VPRASVLLVLAAVLVAERAAADTTLGMTMFGARRPLALDDRPSVSDEVLRNAFGAAMTVVDGPPPDARGLVVRAGLGIEHAADCAWFDRRPSCPFPTGSGPEHPSDPTVSAPPLNRVEYAAHGRVGWDFHYLALEAGAVVYTASDAFPDSPTTMKTVTESHLRPDVVVRAGPQYAWLAVGYGTSSVTTMFYPGFYARGHLDFAERWGFTTSAARADQTSFGHYRLDLDVTYRATRNLILGDGVALMLAENTQNERALTGELRLFVGWRFD